jgi:hypothetical protein
MPVFDVKCTTTIDNRCGICFDIFWDKCSGSVEETVGKWLGADCRLWRTRLGRSSPPRKTPSELWRRVTQPGRDMYAEIDVARCRQQLHVRSLGKAE